MSSLKGAEHRWEELSVELRIPQVKVEEIKKQFLTSVDRLSVVFKYFLQLHPFASWRRIIRALERIEEHVITKCIRAYAEPVSGMFP